MPQKWWRGGISIWAFGGIALVWLFVLFDGLFVCFSCFGDGISFFGVIIGFWWEKFSLVCQIRSLVWNRGVRNKTKKFPEDSSG